MITIISGKSASGKTTVVEKLVSEHGFIQIIPYTTRPPRKGEKQDITYHYISLDEFLKKIDEGFFAEWKAYVTEEGLWYYGTAINDLKNAEDNTVVILTPAGYRDIEKIFSKDNICSIYIYANNTTIENRLLARGDNENEANRRIAHDNADFKSFEYEADKVIYNNDGTNINDVVNRILEFVKEKK